MNEIEDYNCEGRCCHLYCDKKHTHVTTVKIHGMSIHLTFCDDHAQLFEDNKCNDKFCASYMDGYCTDIRGIVGCKSKK